VTILYPFEMLEGARVFKFLVLISILFCFYFEFLLIGMDFHLFVVKLKSMLLTKYLHFLFSRLGWCGGGLVIAIVLTILDPELAKMMAPPGGATGASGPSTPVDSVPQDDIWAALDQRPQAPAPNVGEPEVNHPVQQAQGIPPEAPPNPPEPLECNKNSC